MADDPTEFARSTQPGGGSAQRVSNRRLPPPMAGPRRRILSKLARLLVLALVIGVFWLYARLPEFIENAGFNLVPVRGMVTVDGRPADSARLVFVPLERNFERSLQPISVATTEKNGSFSLQTLAGKPGAARGRHLVYVLPAPDVAEIGSEMGSETGKQPGSDPIEPPTAPDAWREAAGLLGYWISASPVRDETSVPFFGTQTLEIKLQSEKNVGPTD